MTLTPETILAPDARRSYNCRCGRPVFFRNSQCLGCGAALGFEPYLGLVASLEPAAGAPGTWFIQGATGTYLRCANLDSPSGCNWLVPAGEGPVLCRSCRLDRVIPNLSIPSDADCYRRISFAKRRLVALLLSLKLPVASREEDPARGLAFEFLRTPGGGPRVVTGHADGVVTLNIEEAEDPTRERIRTEMGEPYRTLLGHLRHESGHYYWDRLIDGGGWLDEFRSLFGDERQDYAAALDRHYHQGPAPDWQQWFVSSYASAHPWEDWAETWAHHLHIVDTLSTAGSFGLDASRIGIEVEPFGEDVLAAPGAEFLDLLNSWTRLSAVLNELSRAMGLADFYPFVLSRAVVRKLHMVHRVIAAAS